MKTNIVKSIQRITLIGLVLSFHVALAGHEDIELGSIQRGSASFSVIARHFDFGQGNSGTWLIEKAPDGAFLFRGINLSHDGKCDPKSADYWKDALKKKDIKLTFMNPGTDYCGTLMPSSIPGLIPKHTRTTVEDCAVFYKQDNESSEGINKSHKYYDRDQKKCLPCSDGAPASSMCSGVKLGSKKACPLPADGEISVNDFKVGFFKIEGADKGPYIFEDKANTIKIPSLKNFKAFVSNYEASCFKNLEDELFLGCNGESVYYPAIPTSSGDKFTLSYKNKNYSVPKNLDQKNCLSYIYSLEGGPQTGGASVSCQGVTWTDGEELGSYQGTKIFTYIYENRIYLKREDNMDKAVDNIDILYHLSTNKFTDKNTTSRDQVVKCVNQQDASTSGLGLLGGANSEGVLCNGKRIADNTLLGIYTGGDNVKTNVYSKVVDGKLYPNFHREGTTRGDGFNIGLLLSIVKGDGESKLGLSENEVQGCFGRELPKNATPI